MNFIKDNIGDLDETLTPSQITEQEQATVTAMVERRMTGEDRRQVLAMLFDPPQSRRTKAPSKVRDGDPLPPEAKQQIRALISQGGLSDAAIADQLGVSRQAVTGVRAKTRKQS